MGWAGAQFPQLNLSPEPSLFLLTMMIPVLTWLFLAFLKKHPLLTIASGIPSTTEFNNITTKQLEKHIDLFNPEWIWTLMAMKSIRGATLCWEDYLRRKKPRVLILLLFYPQHGFSSMIGCRFRKFLERLTMSMRLSQLTFFSAFALRFWMEKYH